MFFIYNAVVHSSIVVVNIGIIFKEISLEFVRLANSRPEDSGFGLGPIMLWNSTKKIFHIMDPLELFPRAFKFIAGKSFYYALGVVFGSPFITLMSYIY